MIDCAEQKEEAMNMPVRVKHCFWKAMYVILITTFVDPEVGRAGEVHAGWELCSSFQVDSWSNSNFQTNLFVFFFPKLGVEIWTPVRVFKNNSLLFVF